MKSTKPTVTTTATAIVSAGGNGQSPKSCGISVPTGGQTVYIGGPDVTTANGFPLASPSEHFFDLVQEAVYAVVAATTQAVNVITNQE